MKDIQLKSLFKPVSLSKASILTYFESQHERSSYKRLSKINKLNVGKQVLSQEQIVFRKGLSSKGMKIHYMIHREIQIQRGMKSLGKKFLLECSDKPLQLKF